MKDLIPPAVETSLHMGRNQAHVQLSLETAKSGKEKNVEDKKGDKEILAVPTQEVPRIVIAQKLSALFLLLYSCFLALAGAKNSSGSYSIKTQENGPSRLN